MGKIVIPKHSASVKEINAVLRIHYEAGGWVKGDVYKERLTAMIGAGQYSSSYPKKAQIPAYFGFLECKVTAGGRITERRITPSGRDMYEAIMSDDRAARQRLVMEALERVTFGRNNAGCPSGSSDIEAPAVLVRCVLDTGSCTSTEYAYLISALNDKRGKYYEALGELVGARGAGGVSIEKEAEEYKDWKPVLAMLRWGFLVKAGDNPLKFKLHPEVLQRYSHRLHRLKIYNFDKFPAESGPEFDGSSFENAVIMARPKGGYKPFMVDGETIPLIENGSFSQACADIEEQNILAGDDVLFVDRQITRLASYHSYRIKSLAKEGEIYRVALERGYAVNRAKEEALVSGLRAKERLVERRETLEAVRALACYEDYGGQLEIHGHENRDLLPAYLVVRALLLLEYMTEAEQDYMVWALEEDVKSFPEAVAALKAARISGALARGEGGPDYSKLPSVRALREKGILEPILKDGGERLVFNLDVREKYGELLKRLSFYAVDAGKGNFGMGNHDNREA